MKLGSVLFVVVVMLVAGVMDANGQKLIEKDELLTLDRQWQEAVVAGDVKFIEKRTADDFVFTHGGGNRADTKADWVGRTKQVPHRQLKRKASNQTVEIHSDIALVFGRLDVRAITKTDSPPVCYALEYVHLYERRKGQWMFLSHRTTQGIGTAGPCTESENK